MSVEVVLANIRTLFDWVYDWFDPEVAFALCGAAGWQPSPDRFVHC